jgi:hypothetical protein
MEQGPSWEANCLQLVKKFSAFYGTRRFRTALTSARHLSLFWASPIHSSHPHPTSWRSILTNQKFYILLTLRLIILYGLLPCTALTYRFCITEVESVYSAVRTECLYKTENRGIKQTIFVLITIYKFLPIFSKCDIIFGPHWHNKYERDSDVNFLYSWNMTQGRHYFSNCHKRK